MGDDWLKKWTKWAEEQVREQQRQYYAFHLKAGIAVTITLPFDAAQQDAAVLGIAQMLKLDKTLKKIRYAPRAVQTSVELASDTLISLLVTQSGRISALECSYTER
jgi:hypothetical protein